MEKVKTPSFRIVWNGKDITEDITHLTKSVVYEDALEDESDSVEVVCENSDLRWLGSWYPQKGDRIELWIGYKDEQIRIGEFEVDEFEFTGSATGGDEIRIRGIATQLNKPLREKKTRGWENTTLNTIVVSIAKEHGLTPIVEAEDTKIKRIDQRQEGDWHFLKRLAEKYGKVVKIQGQNLYWGEKEKLYQGKPKLTLTREDIISYSFKDKQHSVYRGIKLKYFDKKEKRLKTYTERWPAENPSADWLVVNKDFFSLEEVKAYARSMKLKYVKAEKHGSFIVVGNPLLLASVKFKLEGFLKLDGEWIVERSTHRVGRQEGYTTEIEAKKT